MSDVPMPHADLGNNKRPREGDDATATAPAAKRMVLNLRTPAPLGVQGLPPSHVWTRTVEACNSAGIKVPPPTILHDFGVIHDGALTEYQSAQSQLQKAQVTLERFDQACEGGAVPAIVSNAIKVPHLQLLKGTPDVATTDPDVVLAKTSTHEAIATARKDAIDLCRSTYVAQVIHCKSLVDPVQCADALSAALTDYGRSMINGAPIPGDVHVWDACILRLRNDYAAELTDISYDFVAKLHNEAREKASKANAVSTARAAAETSSAAKPIEDILKDNMQTYLKRLEDVEKKIKPAPQAPTASSSKPKATQPKAGKKQQKPNQPSSTKTPRTGGQSTKRAGADGKKSNNAKKGKGKAKQTEPQDSDSE